LTVLAHLGPLPIEELLATCVIAFTIGAPVMRAKAEAALSRARSRGDSHLS
jgi:hypothetical protein